jgi:hypothetical protein
MDPYVFGPTAMIYMVKFRDPFREKKAKKSVVPIMGQLLRLKVEGGRETRLRLRDQTLATVEDPASSPGTRPLLENLSVIRPSPYASPPPPPPPPSFPP